jgi:hypothetical protein
MALAEEVEAKNFILNIGHLWDGRELVVQPTISRMKEVSLVKRIFTVLMVAAVMAAMVVVMVVPAFASGQDHNPNYYTAPVPGPSHSQGGSCVATYSAPPSQGGSAPGSSATGGEPGYVSNDNKSSDCHGSAKF